MDQAILQTIPPNAQVLKPHIKLYYIHYAQNPDYQQHIIYYPNYTTTLNNYRNTQLTWSDYSRTHTYAPNKKFTSLLVGKFDRSRETITIGPFDKIGIVFNPLGLNHFIDVPLSKIIQTHFAFFDYYGKAYQKLLAQLFEAKSLIEKRDLLDQFFLARFIPFQEERLIKAIQLIHQSTPIPSVQDIANHFAISRKTLLRLFQKHLAYTVKEYMAVIRFRKALISYQESEQKPKFTSLAYEHQYYDQPDFNHQFKLRSGLSPRELFSQIQTIEKGLFWTYPHSK